ncbi:F0F1 ATP synthase subunit delta [Clostridium formicaceticum]|uniref:ATP synthase subunit delta n=1 Tax=Clostridium formicaceticum TaxID=1497 RepID=A0AAC9RH06_9CLOT|nr:F0F1 ATP synthase subunit delta [Clostridium formicaceticum]AOY75581.1 ATP synthase F1 subunit delta [Clostridium formicaceticum]ARE85886.1 ATP synthase subunit delta, sodium ion specific [Clostridium formicaceticum]
MAELIARKYAKALFEVAQEDNNLQPIREELNFIKEALGENENFKKLLHTPLITSNEKKDIVKNVFKDTLTNEVMNFLYILVDKGRVNHIEEIVKEFNVMADASKNMVEAVAITAIPLNKERLQKLQVQLSMASGKNVKLNNEVDESVIGGVLIKMGDKVIDGTLKSRLGHLKQQLSQVIL